MPDFEEVLLGAVIVASSLGILYFLNPDFKGWADKTALPAMDQWGDQYLPSIEDFKRGWEEGRNYDG